MQIESALFLRPGRKTFTIFDLIMEPYTEYTAASGFVMRYLNILFGCLCGVMVRGVRRCSARRARRIRGFNPHRRQNIYMDYVSTVIKKTSVVGTA